VNRHSNHKADGQRLGFTVDDDGNLYAFTTEEGMEKFLQEQSVSDVKSAAADIYSYFYVDMYYGGDFLAVPPGYPQGYIPNLGTSSIRMDNMVSSFIASSTASRVRLYDYTNYGGDYFERSGGSDVGWLFLYGWNDKASSLIVY
jgi:hypothetical protein